MTPTPNDNDARAAFDTREPDAHGQAAYLLVESLIHGLVARRTLTVADAIEVVEIAADVKAQIAGDLGDSPATLRRSLALLNALQNSLQTDQARDLPS